MVGMDIDAPTTPHKNSLPKGPFPITKLPVELILLILGKLNCYFTLLNCQQTCKTFSEIAKDPKLIRNILLKLFPHLAPKNLELDQYAVWAKNHLKTARNIERCLYSTKVFEHPAGLYPLQIYSDNHHLAILYLMYGSPEIGVWNQANQSYKSIQMLMKNSNDFSNILVNKNFVIISYLSHNVEIYDLSKGTFIKALENHRIAGQIFMSGNLLAYCDHSNYNLQKDSSEAKIHIVDLSSGFTVKTVPGHLKARVNDSIDCFASSSGEVNLWNHKSQEVTNTFLIKPLQQISTEDQKMYFLTEDQTIFRLDLKTLLLEGPLYLKKFGFIQLCGKWAIQMDQTLSNNWWLITDLSSFQTWKIQSPRLEISKVSIHFPHLFVFCQNSLVNVYNIKTGKIEWDKIKFKGVSWIKFEDAKLYGMSQNRKKIFILDFK